MVYLRLRSAARFCDLQRSERPNSRNSETGEEEEFYKNSSANEH